MTAKAIQIPKRSLIISFFGGPFAPSLVSAVVCSSGAADDGWMYKGRGRSISGIPEF